MHLIRARKRLRSNSLFFQHLTTALRRNVYVQDTTGFQPDPQLRQQKLEDIQTCYEIKFSHISDRYYKSQPWPHPDQVLLPATRERTRGTVP